MIICCLCGVLSDDTHLECGHQVCSVCLVRSLTDQRKDGLPFGRCAVHRCGQVLREHRRWPLNLGDRVQLAKRTDPTLGFSGPGLSRGRKVSGRGHERGRGYRGMRRRGGFRGVLMGVGCGGGSVVGLMGVARGGGCTGGLMGVGCCGGSIGGSMGVGCGGGNTGGLMGVGSGGGSSGRLMGAGSGGAGGDSSQPNPNLIININLIYYYNYYIFIDN